MRFFKVAGFSLFVLVLGMASGYLWLEHAPRHTPRPQPPLAELDARSLGSLRAAFNAHRGQGRILVLLSPT